MSYLSPRTPRFYRQRVFYGGLVGGFILFPLLFFTIGWAFGPHKTITHAAPTSGNMTIMLDDDVLTLGMRMGLERVKSKIPFVVTNAHVATQAGDAIAVHADGNFGPIVIGMDMTLAPTVDSTGHLAFTITAISAAGADLSLFGFTNAQIENALDQQFADVGSGTAIRGLSYQLEDVHTQTGALVITAKLSPQ